MILDKIKARGEEMAPLEGHDRLQYLIDIAREVPPLDDKDKIDENKIRGCASNRSEITHLTLESFEGLGIRNLLTMQRQVGFGSLVERMITIAKTI